jgi:hypothetical protein
MRDALLKRAESEIGGDAVAFDYVLAWVARGGLISDLANSLADELGESVSRQILSLIVHRMAPDATERIAAARLALGGARAHPPQGAVLE